MRTHTITVRVNYKGNGYDLIVSYNYGSYEIPPERPEVCGWTYDMDITESDIKALDADEEFLNAVNDAFFARLELRLEYHEDTE